MRNNGPRRNIILSISIMLRAGLDSNVSKGDGMIDHDPIINKNGVPTVPTSSALAPWILQGRRFAGRHFDISAPQLDAS